MLIRRERTIKHSCLVLIALSLAVWPIYADEKPPHVLRVIRSLPADWLYVASTWTSTDAIVVSVYTPKTKRAGDRITTWHRTDYDPPQGPEGVPPAAKVVAKIEYDCDDEMARTHDWTVYAASGDVITHSAEIGEWENVVPESLAAAAVEAICSRW